MFKALIIIACLLLSVPAMSHAQSFCKDWPVFKLKDGTLACATVFGPMQGKGFTAATGKFHMLSKFDPNERAHVSRGLSLCRSFKKKIVAQSRALGLKRHDYIVIVQTWKIGKLSNAVDKVQNYTVLADKRCREVSF